MAIVYAVLIDDPMGKGAEIKWFPADRLEEAKEFVRKHDEGYADEGGSVTLHWFDSESEDSGTINIRS